MFLAGDFMSAPFMDTGNPAATMAATGTATVSLLATTTWDEMLADDTLPMIYLADIEPWALTDRS